MRRHWKRILIIFLATGTMGVLPSVPPPEASREPLEQVLPRRLRQFVRTYAPRKPTQIEIPVLDDFLHPEFREAEVRLSANEREDFLGTVPITVVLLRDGRELKRGVVTVQVRVDRAILVASRRLPRGEIIRAADLRSIWVDGAKVPKGIVVDASRLVGKRVARSIREGTPWRAGLIEDAPVVSRGQVVRLRLRVGSLRIQGLGKVRKDARSGDLVRVTNLDSRRELVGRVAEDGTIDVDF